MINKIKHILSGVPFETHADMENYITLLAIASNINGYNDKIPLFVIESSSNGCGKSELARAVISIGGNRGVLSLPIDEESVANIMISIIDSESDVYCFDNVKHKVNSDSISRVIDGELTYRMLGTKDYETRSIKKLFILTGINVQLSSDLERRCVRIKLNGNKIGRWFGFSINALSEAVGGE